MRSARLLVAINWKSALGELVLIFVGITLALAASAWYENRQEREDETRLLSQFRNALSADLDELEAVFETEKRVYSDVSSLLDHMKGSDPHTEEVERFLNAVLLFRGPEANVAAYEVLKSRGFDLIKDEELRYQLINYYEELAPNLRSMHQNDRDMVTAQVIPYFYRHLRAVRTWHFEPIDYEQLRNDVHFHNLAMVKISRLERYLLPNQEMAIESIKRILQSIDSQRQSR